MASGKHPLLQAALEGKIDECKRLLDAGMDVNARGSCGRRGVENGTALHAACVYGHVEIVRLLLDRGANMEAIAAKAFFWGDELHDVAPAHVCALFGREDCLRLLVVRGAHMSRSCRHGKRGAMTVRDVAVWQKDQAIVAMLDENQGQAAASQAAAQRQKEEEQKRKAAEEKKKREEAERKKMEVMRKKEEEEKVKKEQQKTMEEQEKKKQQMEEAKRKEEERKKREEEERKKKKEEEKVKEAAEEKQWRGRVTNLLAAAHVDVDDSAVDVLVEHAFFSADALCAVPLEALKDMGIKTGQAYALKAKFPSGTVSGGGAAAAFTTAPAAAAAASAHASSAAASTSGPLPIDKRTLATSQFKVHYGSCTPTEHSDEMWVTVRLLVTKYGDELGVDPNLALAFARDLQRESAQHLEELLSEVDAAAQRMWTSALQLKTKKVELSAIINHALRCESPGLLPHAVQLTMNMNQLCLTRRPKKDLAFPPNAVCFRGGALPDEHRAFYTVGKMYRVPGFLATSFSEDTAYEFYLRAHQHQRLPAVLWRVHLDPRGETNLRYRCKHVNLVRHTNVPGEEEFLFTPYSVFTVREVYWSSLPDYRNPHVVVLDAAIDNLDHPEDLPLAPWF